ncbi:type II restriction endonuclease [Treponema denticola]
MPLFLIGYYLLLFFSGLLERKNEAVNIIFPRNSSWVILSPIEQRIKEKIEKVGVPLKEWDIRINYGIKTGCNEAFIIDKTKRDELIKQSPNSVDIIRPILRGKDIKKYGYNFADKYLITTFPSKKYNIEDYPAVRDYLLNFGKSDTEYLSQYGNDCWGKNRLAQSGNKGSRKKTHNKWFELQDSIAYWDDFNKQKIIWTDIACKPSFVFSDKEIYFLNTAYMLSGHHLYYLLHILNSKLITFYFTHTATGLGNKGLRLFKIFVEKIPIPVYVNSDIQRSLDSYKPVINLQSEQEKINKWVNQLYHLNTEEIGYINSISE